MPDTFRWLHLTDLHWGSKSHKYEWSIIEKKLLADIQKLQKEEYCGGPFDAVFFTGDLVDKGLPKQFQEVNKKLQKIWSVVKTKHTNPWFLAVPGNHDLTRPRKDNGGLRLLRRFHQEADGGSIVWDGKAGPEKSALQSAFKNYLAWWQKLPTDFRKPETLSPGLLPGEYAATLVKGKMSIGVLGLNTAFLQLEGGEFEKKLAMDARQIAKACGEDYTGWVDRHQVCFLLTHHPASWLSDAATEQYEKFIYQPEHFAAHLCGHVHKSGINDFSSGGPEVARRQVTALSLFGREKVKTITGGGTRKDSIARAFGYAAGLFDLDGNQGYIKTWPRRLVEKEGNLWALEKDYRQSTEDDGATAPKPVNVRSIEKINSKTTAKQSEQKPPTPGQKAEFKKVVQISLQNILDKKHFTDFKKELRQGLAVTRDPLDHMLNQLDLLSSMRCFTETIQKLKDSKGLSSQLLLDCEIFMGWLSLLAIREDWQPPLDPSLTSESQEIDVFIPVSYEASLEIVLSRLTYIPARFINKPTGTLSFRGSGHCLMPDLAEIGPHAADMVNAIKASLWVTMAPEDEEKIFKRNPDGSKYVKPFTARMDRLLVARLKYRDGSARSVTPYFLINRERGAVEIIPSEVIRILRTDLNPLKIISFGEDGDIWDGTLKEEDVITYLEEFYKVVREARKELKD